MLRKYLQIITESVSDANLRSKISNCALACFESQHRATVRRACSNMLFEAGTENPFSEIFVKIENGDWETNGDIDHDYPIFMDSLRKSRHPNALTWYTKDEYAEKGARLYKVRGFDAGFAISGDGDIISVHNNTDIRGVAPALIKAAIELGGDHLDHYDIGRLNDVYEGAGLKEYAKFDWSDEYAPEGWDYDTDGRPGVKLRGLPSYIERQRQLEAEKAEAEI